MLHVNNEFGINSSKMLLDIGTEMTSLNTWKTLADALEIIKQTRLRHCSFLTNWIKEEGDVFVNQPVVKRKHTQNEDSPGEINSIKHSLLL